MKCELAGLHLDIWKLKNVAGKASEPSCSSVLLTSKSCLLEQLVTNL